MSPQAQRSQLGRYTLLDKIGRGGFGVVYRALDPALGRTVAIKLLQARRAPDGVGVLLHEARIAAQLQHPNIVRIFDLGRIEDRGLEHGADVFIVMELLDGEPLHRWLRPGTRTHPRSSRSSFRSPRGSRQPISGPSSTVTSSRPTSS